MKVLVLGAGVVGMATAYALARRGHTVEIVERREASALETSFANGGQLSFSHAEPWANPRTLASAWRMWGKEDSPIHLHPRIDPALWKWSARFVLNCRASRAQVNTQHLLRLGMYSRECFQPLARDFSGMFEHRKAGTLHIYRAQEGLDHAAVQAEFQRAQGGVAEVWDADICHAREPALKQSRQKIIGGIYHPEDESGDAHAFTQAMAAALSNNPNVKFHYDTVIQSLAMEKGRWRGVVTDHGRLEGDACVVALGVVSTPLLRPLGIKLPVYPLKGYSVTLPVEESGADVAPSMAITDNERKMVYSRLGNRLRAAGLADLGEMDANLRPERIVQIAREVQALFPHCIGMEKAMFWTGLRPATPDGIPVLGPSGIDGLYLNSGHGTLGWTLSAGSASVLAHVVEGKSSPITLDGLTLARFR